MNETVGLRALNAPELVKKFRSIIGGYVNIGRDSKLMKEFLERATPAQILLGIYQYKDSKTITVPMFLRYHEDWLILDETEADIELAVCVSETLPPAYLIWQDFRNEQSAYAVGQSEQALKELLVWVDKVLS